MKLLLAMLAGPQYVVLATRLGDRDDAIQPVGSSGFPKLLMGYKSAPSRPFSRSDSPSIITTQEQPI